MILPDFILTTRQNQYWLETGLDSSMRCLDKKHFNSYPHKVEYQFNSRGFRDAEWPTDASELYNSIWCVGDSFTVGLGTPLSMTWPNILQTTVNRRCINVSLDGASNMWIARRCLKILEEISPKTIILHWSYINRYESSTITSTDEDRRERDLLGDPHKQFSALINLIKSIEQHKGNTRVIHSFVPNFCGFSEMNVNKLWKNVRGSSWPLVAPTEKNKLTDSIKKELGNDIDIFNLRYDTFSLLENLPVEWVPEIAKEDLARDGYHYGIITATNFAKKLISKLA